MPGSVGNTGLAGNHVVKCCQVVSSDFEVIRLKIRLNFVAARNVPVPLAQKMRWAVEILLPTWIQSHDSSRSESPFESPLNPLILDRVA